MYFSRLPGILKHSNAVVECVGTATQLVDEICRDLSLCKDAVIVWSLNTR